MPDVFSPVSDAGQGFQHTPRPDTAQARRQPRRRADQFLTAVLCPMHKRIASRVCQTFSSQDAPATRAFAHLRDRQYGVAQLAQGDQIAFAEKMLNGAFCCPAI